MKKTEWNTIHTSPIPYLKMQTKQQSVQAEDRWWRIYCTWRLENGWFDPEEHHTDAVLLDYFKFLKPKFSGTTLWTARAVLSKRLYKEFQIDMSQYRNLAVFFKQLSDSYYHREQGFLSQEMIEDLWGLAPNQRDDRDFVIMAKAIVTLVTKSNSSYLTL